MYNGFVLYKDSFLCSCSYTIDPWFLRLTKWSNHAVLYINGDEIVFIFVILTIFDIGLLGW